MTDEQIADVFQKCTGRVWGSRLPNTWAFVASFARAILDAQRLEFVEFLREQHRKRDQIGDNTFLVAANKYEAMK